MWWIDFRLRKSKLLHWCSNLNYCTRGFKCSDEKISVYGNLDYCTVCNNLNFCTRAAARVQKFFHHYIWNPACNNLFITKFEMRFTALLIIGNKILILLLHKIIHSLGQFHEISKPNYCYFIAYFNENSKPDFRFVFVHKNINIQFFREIE